MTRNEEEIPTKGTDPKSKSVSVTDDVISFLTTCLLGAQNQVHSATPLDYLSTSTYESQTKQTVKEHADDQRHVADSRTSTWSRTTTTPPFYLVSAEAEARQEPRALAGESGTP